MTASFSHEPSRTPGAARLAAPTVNRPWLLRLTRASGAVPAAALLHDGFQVIEIFRESPAAGAGELTARLRPAANELLVDGDVALLFQFLQMHTQVAVRHAQRIAQLGERQARRRRQCRDNRQPAALVQQRIEFVKKPLQGVHKAALSRSPLRPLNDTAARPARAAPRSKARNPKRDGQRQKPRPSARWTNLYPEPGSERPTATWRHPASEWPAARRRRWPAYPAHSTTSTRPAATGGRHARKRTRSTRRPQPTRV